MKTVFILGLALILSACSATAPKVDGESAPRRGGGKQFNVGLAGVELVSTKEKTFFLVPQDSNVKWTTSEQFCVKTLAKALQLDGYVQAESEHAAVALIGVAFPKSESAKGFSFTALLGGFNHRLELQAHDQQKTELWKLSANMNSEFDDKKKSCPVLALAMVEHFSTEIDKNVSVDEFDPRLESVTQAGSL